MGKLLQLSVLRSKPQRAVLCPGEPGTDTGPVIGLVLIGAVRAVFLIGPLLAVQQIEISADGEHVKIPVDRRSGVRLSGQLHQRRGDEVAPLLGIFLPGQLLRRNGVDAPLREKQRLLTDVGEGERRHRRLSQQRIGHPEQGLPICIQTAGTNNSVAAHSFSLQKSGQRIAQNGIAHHGTAVPAYFGIGGIREIGGVLKTGVPVLPRLVGVPGEEDPVLRAPHTIHGEDPALVDLVGISLPGFAGSDTDVVLPLDR